jgi:hypothetical protein
MKRLELRGVTSGRLGPTLKACLAHESLESLTFVEGANALQVGHILGQAAFTKCSNLLSLYNLYGSEEEILDFLVHLHMRDRFRLKAVEFESGSLSTRATAEHSLSAVTHYKSLQRFHIHYGRDALEFQPRVAARLDWNRLTRLGLSDSLLRRLGCTIDNIPDWLSFLLNEWDDDLTFLYRFLCHDQEESCLLVTFAGWALENRTRGSD